MSAFRKDEKEAIGMKKVIIGLIVIAVVVTVIINIAG